jgi:hypothetical protein
MRSKEIHIPECEEVSAPPNDVPAPKDVTAMRWVLQKVRSVDTSRVVRGLKTTAGVSAADAGD